MLAKNIYFMWCRKKSFYWKWTSVAANVACSRKCYLTSITLHVVSVSFIHLWSLSFTFFKLFISVYIAIFLFCTKRMDTKQNFLFWTLYFLLLLPSFRNLFFLCCCFKIFSFVSDFTCFSLNGLYNNCPTVVVFCVWQLSFTFSLLTYLKMCSLTICFCM